MEQTQEVTTLDIRKQLEEDIKAFDPDFTTLQSTQDVLKVVMVVSAYDVPHLMARVVHMLEYKYPPSFRVDFYRSLAFFLNVDYVHPSTKTLAVNNTGEAIYYFSHSTEDDYDTAHVIVNYEPAFDRRGIWHKITAEFRGF